MLYAVGSSYSACSAAAATLALAGFIPNCLVHFKRLAADPRVDRRLHSDMVELPRRGAAAGGIGEAKQRVREHERRQRAHWRKAGVSLAETRDRAYKPQ